MELPEFSEVIEKIDKGEDLNPIEYFIYQFEPFGDRDSYFREALKDALEYDV